GRLRAVLRPPLGGGGLNRHGGLARGPRPPPRPGGGRPRPGNRPPTQRAIERLLVGEQLTPAAVQQPSEPPQHPQHALPAAVLAPAVPLFVAIEPPLPPAAASLPAPDRPHGRGDHREAPLLDQHRHRHGTGGAVLESLDFVEQVAPVGRQTDEQVAVEQAQATGELAELVLHGVDAEAEVAGRLAEADAAREQHEQRRVAVWLAVAVVEAEGLSREVLAAGLAAEARHGFGAAHGPVAAAALVEARLRIAVHAAAAVGT